MDRFRRNNTATVRNSKVCLCAFFGFLFCFACRESQDGEGRASRVDCRRYILCADHYRAEYVYHDVCCASYARTCVFKRNKSETAYRRAYTFRNRRTANDNFRAVPLEKTERVHRSVGVAKRRGLSANTVALRAW